MKHLATLSYDDIDFVWVNNHYDVHISGLCRLGFNLFYFKTINHDSDEELMCEVYMLSWSEEIKWKLKKFFFEQMVGYHWSYPKRNNGHFHYRKPEWLYKRLFWLYYTIKKLLK
jgi:hypothetical protein